MALISINVQLQGFTVSCYLCWPFLTNFSKRLWLSSMRLVKSTSNNCCWLLCWFNYCLSNLMQNFVYLLDFKRIKQMDYYHLIYNHPKKYQCFFIINFRYLTKQALSVHFVSQVVCSCINYWYKGHFYLSLAYIVYFKNKYITILIRYQKYLNIFRKQIQNIKRSWIILE